MSIIGIGVDIVQNNRLKKLVKNKVFYKEYLLRMSKNLK